MQNKKHKTENKNPATHYFVICATEDWDDFSPAEQEGIDDFLPINLYE
ncbi:MAG: hypothetical protein WBG71_09860 [Leeuwenhoekiella sp.]